MALVPALSHKLGKCKTDRTGKLIYRLIGLTKGFMLPSRNERKHNFRPAGGFVLDYHDPPVPESCLICAYVRDHAEANQRLEHTMTIAAAAIIADDLTKLGQPRSFQSIAVGSIGFPGASSAD